MKNNELALCVLFSVTLRKKTDKTYTRCSQKVQFFKVSLIVIFQALSFRL